MIQCCGGSMQKTHSWCNVCRTPAQKPEEYDPLIIVPNKVRNKLYFSHLTIFHCYENGAKLEHLCILVSDVNLKRLLHHVFQSPAMNQNLHTHTHITTVGYTTRGCSALQTLKESVYSFCWSWSKSNPQEPLYTKILKHCILYNRVRYFTLVASILQIKNQMLQGLCMFLLCSKIVS